MSPLLTVREYSKKYGNHETQLTRDAAAGKIFGAVRNQGGHWMLPDKPAVDQSVFAGLPDYTAMDLDTLRIQKLALECKGRDMELREKEGNLIPRGETYGAHQRCQSGNPGGVQGVPSQRLGRASTPVPAASCGSGQGRFGTCCGYDQIRLPH